MTATLTLADVARLTGVTRPAVNEWIQRFNSESIAPFPAPYGEHDGHPYYAITEIQDCCEQLSSAAATQPLKMPSFILRSTECCSAIRHARRWAF
ncbi:TPA: helix-turn-helix domain-containing protein [Corynebacterium striatum]